MAKIDEVVKKQIERTDARYRERQKEQENRNANIYLGGDWRKVETPQRVLRRMVALGLNDLAGTMMGTEAVTDGVESAIQRDKKVSLLERIIEENDLLSSRFLHIGSTVARAVGRIQIRSRGRIVGYGTGFLVSSRLLMTNNHVLETETVAGRSAVEFDYYERRTGQTGPTVLFEFEPQLFFLTDEDLDFTLVAVKTQSTTGTPLTEQGWIPLITDSGKALIGEPVNIIQHPRGAPQQIVIKNNEIADCIDSFFYIIRQTPSRALRVHRFLICSGSLPPCIIPEFPSVTPGTEFCCGTTRCGTALDPPWIVSPGSPTKVCVSAASCASSKRLWGMNAVPNAISSRKPLGRHR
jgi:hypothetical protein